MKIADVKLGTEYVLDDYRTNAQRGRAVEITTVNEGTEWHPRNVRLVVVELTRVSNPDHWRHPVMVGQRATYPARKLLQEAEAYDAQQRAAQERDDAQRAAVNAVDEALTGLGFGGNTTRYGRAVHVVLSIEEATEFASVLTTTTQRAAEFALTEAEILP
jgi:hypothetical protein